MKTITYLILCFSVLFAGCAKHDAGKIVLDQAWSFRVDSTNVGEREKWYEVNVDRSRWTQHVLPAFWDQYNLAGYDG
ncbi:MAG: hypothetical protein HY966_04465, partial [Ignavibacteriales bacterium]|nr:hypothetical protein [Ignavibacteriales bacterium]